MTKLKTKNLKKKLKKKGLIAHASIIPNSLHLI